MAPMTPRPVLRPDAARRILSFLAACVLLASCSRSAAESPPETRQSIVVDTINGVAVEDRYRWLEEQDSPEVLAWIETQRQYAERILGLAGRNRRAPRMQPPPPA